MNYRPIRKIMKIKPISLKKANEFVAHYHRHNKPVQGHKWSIALYAGALEDYLVGVAITGRPVARLLDDGLTLEILRVCTDGTERNANSCLYGAVAKIARVMGYEKLITYTLQKETGASLKAIGAKIEAEIKPQNWDRPNRKRQNQEVYAEPKYRWKLF